MAFGLIAGIAGSLISSRAQSKAADKATDAQVAANRETIDFARESRDLTRSDLNPFYRRGVRANNALAGEIMGTDVTAPSRYKSPVDAPWEFDFGTFEESPGYQFRLNQGLEAAQGGAVARHGLNSGATMQALNNYAQGAASAEYGDWYNRRMGEYDRNTQNYWTDYNRNAAEYDSYMNRLSGLAASGQNAAAGMGSANALASGQVTQAYGNIGNAQAAGSIAKGNALSDGIGNMMGAWQMNSLLNGGNNALAGGGWFG